MQNPSQYSRLIGTARKELKIDAECATFIPNPGFVIGSELVESEVIQARDTHGATVQYFVNVCQSERILAPYDKAHEIIADLAKAPDEFALPVSIGSRRVTDLPGSARRIITDVVVHPSVYQEARSNPKFKLFASFLILDRVLELEVVQYPHQRVEFRKSSLNFPNISYKAGKQPCAHTVTSEANPEVFNAMFAKRLKVPESPPQELVIPSVGAKAPTTTARPTKEIPIDRFTGSEVKQVRLFNADSGRMKLFIWLKDGIPPVQVHSVHSSDNRICLDHNAGSAEIQCGATVPRMVSFDAKFNTEKHCLEIDIFI